MSYLHDEIDEDTAPHSAYQEPARELTLSTGTILGIFFGLALLCAVFFGFGYSMGSKTRSVPIVTADTSTPNSANFNGFKPAPGSPVSTSHPQTAPTTEPTTVIAATTPEPASTAYTSEPTSTPVPVAPVRTPEAPESPRATAIPDGSFVVQIAAVSHQEDADLLVTALKRKGYSVVARNEPQDKLFHIQVGPFPIKKDAEAMRQRLLGDGYNAIVK
jgi:DedD protein